MTTPTNEELMTQLGVTAQQAAALVQYFEGVRADIGDNMGIEYGNNANGKYTKLPGGLLICSRVGETATNLTTDNESNSLFFKAITVSFPYEFSDMPVVINSSVSSGVRAATETGEIRNDNCVLIIQSPNAVTVDFKINYLAIGRWK